jgi:formamidopyrimidine-DNA glycosylase
VRVGDFPGVVGELGVTHFTARIVNRAISGISRRGKYLLLALDDGATLMIHLRMTGSLAVVVRAAPPLRFERLAIELDDGHDLRFVDQRKFGRVEHWSPLDVQRLDDRLGPEPLSAAFTADRLRRDLARRSGKLKSVLLDQSLVAGLGNIYVDEALHHARLHPERTANTLRDEEVRRLHRAIRAVLREGVANRGTTISSFQDAAGEIGTHQHALRVYGRGDGGGCQRCGRSLARTVVGGRGTHFCPHCQPAL